ncbi:MULTISPECIES: TetR/AcrR family transcriptional regulator [Streptomyces]|uniref:TetR/AcrR family transcriptional regulator n=1 Tax=Streptomyces TaxID=1883 RepID=UPI0004BD481E|nr:MULTISPECIES: TetR/AcrR family transcriptional regulator [Streptomyces]QHF96922.1 TetR family transcriptional regulator [Streptomyces sp. NHF165]
MTSTADEQQAAHGSGGKPEGRRERKKRETRRRISDIATGLFLQRGFDAVTVAEIAEAADVSVNTVYNYFPAKEDLFFDREEEMIDRPSVAVREREPGRSAADAVLGQLRQDISEHSLYAGMREGFDEFMRCVREAPPLMSRLMLMQHKTAQRLYETLVEETGAAPDDPVPELVAAELVNICNLVSRGATRATAEGASHEQVARQALARLDTFEKLATDELLKYATKPAR